MKRSHTLCVLILSLLFFMVIGCPDSDSDSDPDDPDLVSVSGTVYDVTGDPVEDAQVTISSDPVMVATDSQGYFTALVAPGSHTINITYASATIYTDSFICYLETPMDLGDIATTYDPSRAGDINLPDSGQTTCYDAPGNTITCPPPGDPMAQDGSYTINPISSTDNDDGTITDNVTGLMWQKEDDDYTYNWYESTGTAETTYNPDGMTDACGSLTLGGYSDWRLPVKKELMGIVNFDKYAPAIDTTYFPNTNAAYYWSSTPNSKFSKYAWPVGFWSGIFYFSNDKSDENYVRCVRGEERPSNSFSDNGDGTVTDNITGLLWQKESAGIPVEIGTRITFIWEEALSYCEELTLAGNSDWRLPNIKELESIVDDTKCEPAIDTAYFSVYESWDFDPLPGIWYSNYWSSTSSTSGPDKANFIDFEYGYPNALLKIVVHYYVRCVRGGQ